MAGIRSFDIGLLSPVDEQLKATNDREFGLFICRNSANCKNVVRADGNAWPGGFTAHGIDNWNQKPGVEFAVWIDIPAVWLGVLFGRFHVCLRDTTFRISETARSRMAAIRRASLGVQSRVRISACLRAWRAR